MLCHTKRVVSSIQRYSRYLAMSAQSKQDIQNKINENKVVVFMKGVPDAPQCGFSNAIIQIMNIHGVDNFAAHNVLTNEELRNDIKEFSDWPTIPQVYVDGEFIGGCDIMIQMHQSGELIDVLKSVGIRSLMGPPAESTDS